MTLQTLIADYNDPQHCSDIIKLLDHYAKDPMGGAAPISDYTKEHLIAALKERDFAFSLLCYLNNDAVGLCNCFEGFSTFQCKPLINIHDIVVHQSQRGKGIAQKLLQKVEEIARQKGCSKITLEVLEHNQAAQRSYQYFGFTTYSLSSKTGNAWFWEKPVKN